MLIFLIFFQNTSAQTFSLYDGGCGFVQGAYYKDTQNDFNKYVGTWEYVENNNMLTIKFEKRVNHYDSNFGFSYDMLVGEYKFIEDGVLKADTQTDILDLTKNLFENSFSGNYLAKNRSTNICAGCTASDKFVTLSYLQPNRDYLMVEINIYYYTDELGVPFIKIQVRHRDSYIPENGTSDTIIPEGDYVLAKVPN